MDHPMGATEHDVALGVAVDGGDNIYVIGATGGDIDMAKPKAARRVLHKLDATGAIEWTVQWAAPATTTHARSRCSTRAMS